MGQRLMAKRVLKLKSTMIILYQLERQKAWVESLGFSNWQATPDPHYTIFAGQSGIGLGRIILAATTQN